MKKTNLINGNVLFNKIYIYQWWRNFHRFNEIWVIKLSEILMELFDDNWLFHWRIGSFARTHCLIKIDKNLSSKEHNNNVIASVTQKWDIPRVWKNDSTLIISIPMRSPLIWCYRPSERSIIRGRLLRSPISSHPLPRENFSVVCIWWKDYLIIMFIWCYKIAFEQPFWFKGMKTFVNKNVLINKRVVHFSPYIFVIYLFL